VAVDQPAGRDRVESAETELRESGRLEVSNLALPGGEEHDDRLDLEPPGDEDKGVGGRVVEPLCIVDEAEERLTFGGLGEQAQGCERDVEAIVASPRPEAERSTEGGGLGLRKVRYVAKNWADDLVQGREGEVRL
jgi:hypothetical protein